MRRRTACLLAVAALLTACTGIPRGLEPVGGFEPERYLGTWYEIKRLDHSFERNLTNVTATYTAREDGRIGVLNRGWNTRDCDWSEVEGTARFTAGPDTASLAVQFFWPLEGGYHVIELGEEYDYALVSGPTRGFLWLLARDPDLDEATIARLVAIAAEAGFATDELIRVSHGEPVCEG